MKCGRCGHIGPTTVNGVERGCTICGTTGVYK